MHNIKQNMLENTVRVALVGCGGVGSQVLTGLARLHTAMLALGHPGGLEVTAYDNDTVSVSNVGRQLFSPADVGQNKAFLLIHRINTFFGLNWDAVPVRFGSERYTNNYDVIISCVDTKQSRRDIKKIAEKQRCYWLDTGNDVATGQVVLGCYSCNKEEHLPSVVEMFPEILDESIPEDNTPTCSLAEALESQDLFIGQSVATFALQMLWSLFRNGQVNHHGYFINLKEGMVLPMKIEK